jgi:type III secretory pathway component EscS
MSEEYKLKNVFVVALVIGAVVLLASIVGVIVNLP